MVYDNLPIKIGGFSPATLELPEAIHSGGPVMGAFDV